MKKQPGRIVRALGIILGVILAAVIGLRLFFPVEKVRTMAVEMASRELGREISVGDVGLSLSGGLGVRLEDVVVANPSGIGGEPLLRAGKIDLKLELPPLLKGRFRVHRLVVDRPRVQLVQLADGSNNFTFEMGEKSAVPGKTPGPGDGEAPAEIAVSFDRLEVHDGRLAYHDEAAGLQADLIGLKLASDLTNPRTGVFRSAGLLQVDSLLVAGQQPLPALSARLVYELSFDTGRRTAELKQGDLRLNGIPLGFTGRVTARPDSLRATGEVRADHIALADLLVFLTPEQLAPLESFAVEGDVSLEADLDFDGTRAGPPAYKGRIRVAGLRASSPDITGELRIREVLVDFTPDRLQVSSEGGSFAEQPLDLALAVTDFEDPRVEGAVSGSLDLAVVKPFLPPERKVDLGGMCRVEATFSGRTENAAEMDYAGRIVFQDVFFRDPGLPDALEKLDGAVSFDPASVKVEKLDAVFGAGDLSLTGKLVDHLPYFLPGEKANRDSLPKPSFTFDVRAVRIDVDRLFPASTPGAGPSGATAAALTDTTAPDESLPDMLLQGTVRADTLIYGKVPFTDVTGRIRMRDRILETYAVTAKVYGGSARGKVTVDLNNLNDPGYSGSFEATDIEANDFVTRFADFGAGVVFGKASLSGSFSARGRDPGRIRSTLTMDSKAAMTSGKVVTGGFVDSALGSLAGRLGQELDREQALEDLTTMIKVENGRVGLDRFRTELGSLGELSLGGSYGFAGDLDYRGSILLTREQTARLYAGGGLAGSVARMFGDDAERLNLPLTVGGTVTSPRMGLDFTGFTNNLKSQVTDQARDDLKDQVGKKLKGLFGK